VTIHLTDNNLIVPQVALPLGRAPQIAQIAVGTHGLRETEVYRLPELWCLHLYRYHATLIVDDLHVLPIRPGMASILPPNAKLEYRMNGRSQHLYTHFRVLALNDEQRSDTVHVPLMQDLGDDFGRLYELLAQAADEAVNSRARGEARLWDLLWQIAQRPAWTEKDGQEISRTAAMAARIIEIGLEEELRAQQIASQIGVSSGYLTQVFRKSFGQTVMGYIRLRRMQRAKHLLTNSTLPVKFIAAMVGIPDLQHFNKTVRRTFGRSPSEMRGC
jgi:AraC family transcriptional regulator